MYHRRNTGQWSIFSDVRDKLSGTAGTQDAAKPSILSEGGEKSITLLEFFFWRCYGRVK